MAQPNVAREPSMEEILASIRRIIESNEPGQGVDFASSHSYSEKQDLEQGSELRSPPAHVPPPANQAFGQRQVPERLESFSPVQNKAPQAEAPMSLADVAARVRAAADRNAAMAVNGGRAPEPQTPQVNVQPAAPAAPSTNAQNTFYGDNVQRTPRPTDVRPLLAQTATPVREEPSFRVPEQEIERRTASTVNDWNDVNLRSRAPVQVEAPATQVAVEPAAAPKKPAIDIDEPSPVEAPISATSEHSLSPLSANLLSEMAEKEIARSFEELQTLFNVEETPNVEDMTREMLRPMLQEWLEDNLPTIVERLVREEISRVVRGSRR